VEASVCGGQRLDPETPVRFAVGGRAEGHRR
jgi:hypothetical protein